MIAERLAEPDSASACKPVAKRRPTAKAVAEPILVPLGLLRPTQATVGMRAVAAKRQKLETRAKKPSKITNFLAERPIPAVHGPGGRFYIIDHHHLTLALWLSEVGNAFVRVTKDFSGLAPAQFWQRMEKERCVHPFDEQGRRIAPSKLPREIGLLRPDPFRDLAWSVREAGGYEKSPEPYAEFRWAEFFRSQISLRTVKRDYDKAVAKCLKLAEAVADGEFPAFDLAGWPGCS